MARALELRRGDPPVEVDHQRRRVVVMPRPPPRAAPDVFRPGLVVLTHERGIVVAEQRKRDQLLTHLPVRPFHLPPQLCQIETPVQAEPLQPEVFQREPDLPEVSAVRQRRESVRELTGPAVLRVVAAHQPGAVETEQRAKVLSRHGHLIS
jgi:hypothetical protein